MIDNIIAFVPLAFLIATALITKKMAESMISAALLAVVIYYKQHCITGLVDTLYDTLSNPSFQFIIIIVILFGGVNSLLQESGALIGFGNSVSKFADGPRKPLVLSWLMAVAMFVDDFMAIMTATVTMKGTTDRNRIPREHTAFTINTVACSAPLVIPFSSWTAFTMGLLAQYDMGYDTYVSAVPYMFYPIIMIVVPLLLAVGALPKVGPLKTSYKRVEDGGPLCVKEQKGASIIDIEIKEDGEEAHALYAIIPILFIIIGVFLFDKNLIYGLILGLAAQFVLYVILGKMDISGFFEFFFDGAKSMLTLIIIVCFGFSLSSINQKLGLFDILIGGIGRGFPVWLIPVIVFVVVGFTVFATAGCWVMQVIAMPIFVPLGAAIGCPMSYILAAMMSGTSLGYATCFYADALFLTSAGTGVSNIRIVQTSLPYALPVAAVTTACYLILGFLMLA